MLKVREVREEEAFCRLHGSSVVSGFRAGATPGLGWASPKRAVGLAGVLGRGWRGVGRGHQERQIEIGS